MLPCYVVYISPYLSFCGSNTVYFYHPGTNYTEEMTVNKGKLVTIQVIYHNESCYISTSYVALHLSSTTKFGVVEYINMGKAMFFVVFLLCLLAQGKRF